MCSYEGGRVSWRPQALYLESIYLPPERWQSAVHSGACVWVGERSGGQFSKEWLRDLGLLHLEKRKLREILRWSQ